MRENFDKDHQGPAVEVRSRKAANSPVKKLPKPRGKRSGKAKPYTPTARDLRRYDHLDRELKGALKCFGGSRSDDFNEVLLAQVIGSLSRGNTNETGLAQRYGAAIWAMGGIRPKDELEGMIAAQLVASHNAAMECHRRANNDQTFEGRKEHLNQANKLSRTFATLLEGLNRHRGKGQQKVTVEHVHVHEGGQAIVGNVGTQGGGMLPKPEDQAHAKQIAHAPGAPLPSADTARDGVSIAGDAERPVPDARGHISRTA
jgi:hypothetical protein